MKFQRLTAGIASIALAAASVGAGPFIATSYADVGGELSTVEVTGAIPESLIQKKINDINESYEVGEPFSAEDSAFILAHTEPVQNEENSGMALASTQTSSFDVTKTKYSTGVRAKGSIYHTDGKFELTHFSYTYGGNVSVSKTSGKTPKKIVVKIACVAYGAMGSDGLIGKVYDDCVKSSKANASSFKVSLSKDYQAVAVTRNVSCTVKIRTASGDVFTISE